MVKLSNGEDIICNVEDENGHILIISSPLKMETYNRTTEKGMIESLGLSRWIQPYSDEDEFTIHKNTVVLMTPVSAGLKRYYEYVLKSMEDMDLNEDDPTEKQIKYIKKLGGEVPIGLTRREASQLIDELKKVNAMQRVKDITEARY